MLFLLKNHTKIEITEKWDDFRFDAQLMLERRQPLFEIESTQMESVINKSKGTASQSEDGPYNLQISMLPLNTFSQLPVM